MPCFNGPSPDASGHAVMMRLAKPAKGRGCVVRPFTLIIAGAPLIVRLMA